MVTKVIAGQLRMKDVMSSHREVTGITVRNRGARHSSVGHKSAQCRRSAAQARQIGRPRGRGGS